MAHKAKSAIRLVLVVVLMVGCSPSTPGSTPTTPGSTETSTPVPPTSTPAPPVVGGPLPGSGPGVNGPLDVGYITFRTSHGYVSAGELEMWIYGAHLLAGITGGAEPIRPSDSSHILLEKIVYFSLNL